MLLRVNLNTQVPAQSPAIQYCVYVVKFECVDTGSLSQLLRCRVFFFKGLGWYFTAEWHLFFFFFCHCCALTIAYCSGVKCVLHCSDLAFFENVTGPRKEEKKKERESNQPRNTADVRGKPKKTKKTINTSAPCFSALKTKNINYRMLILKFLSAVLRRASQIPMTPLNTIEKSIIQHAQCTRAPWVIFTVTLISCVA